MREWEGECACERMSVVCARTRVNVCGSVCGVCIYSCECVWCVCVVSVCGVCVL